MSSLPIGRSVESKSVCPWSVSRWCTLAIVLLVGLLLGEVLLEAWAQVLTGPISTDPQVNLDNAAQWPKRLKNGLYLGLAALTVVKILVDRRWRDFRTSADYALIGLGAVMVLSGLLNDSTAVLMGQALFVYFRGVIVFYALRAADLEWKMVRRILFTVGLVLAIDVLLALVQMFVGEPAYTALGWVDLTWAEQSRVQGLLSHPNHLGHVLGLALLGFAAWAATRDRVRVGWWAAAAAGMVALSATQSRESILGVLVAGLPIVVIAGRRRRRVLAIYLILILCAVTQIVARPDNRAEWQRRFDNAIAAFHHPVGSEATRTPAGGTTGKPNITASPAGAPSSPDGAGSTAGADVGAPSPTAKASPSAGKPPATPVREIRVLYLQQAARIIQRQPLLGFGIGQFGGVVAEKNNPSWNKNPKFGPEGFNRYGFKAVQVDSFWLHLTMEVGFLGLLVYLVWLFLVVRPLLNLTRTGRESGGEIPLPFVVWGVAAVLFGCVVAFLSPALEDPLLPAVLWAIVGVAWRVRFPAKDGQQPAPPSP